MRSSANLERLRELFVEPFYLQLLNGNLLDQEGNQQQHFSGHLTLALNSITDSQLRMLIEDFDWRTRLTGAWYIALTGRSSFAPRVARLLAASNGDYAEQGYCFAMGLLGGEKCRKSLVNYLTSRLPCRDSSGHELWALGAIAHIDGRHPYEFMRPHLWAGASPEGDYPLFGIERFEKLVDIIRRSKIAMPLLS